MKIKIATWNVNSIRSRLPNFKEWVEDSKPDIVCIQELKCEENTFPKEEIEDLGFNIAMNLQKTYNGVAILSKFPMEDIFKDLPNYRIDGDDEEKRYIEAVVNVNKKAIRIASIYVPNGAQMEMAPGQEVNQTERFHYKMKFFDRLKKRFEEILKYDEIGFFCGDYNVCPEIFDMYSPKKDGDVTCHIDERKKFRAFLNIGMVDTFRAKNPNKQEFTWWDYRTKGWENSRGLRLDHILSTPLGIDKVKSCDIESKETRGKDKPSDHAPVVCVVEI
jgi:exodeoxyribonuclease-3